MRAYMKICFMVFKLYLLQRFTVLPIDQQGELR